ncbi:hypothetical protein [Methanolobus halotolerans]|uniref:Uncharacterized protein n=1 Tax=Methanolobus halotolerans TaxID=2052935 RepID=A0A4E0PYQ2_9EURY|nr:hypothetical protein [Methanolobus halotolerans]TGC11418.1 hypothetical protein CUN85_00620 [Methanolobus halotolerans]
MSSLTWSKNAKQVNKGRQDFTPNIYRKPVKNDDEDKEQHMVPSSGGQGKTDPQGQDPKVKELEDGLEDIREKYEAEIREYRERETVLAEVKSRYESEMGEYRQKQEHLKQEMEELSRQEKDLNRKCALLISATSKVENLIPEIEINDLEEKRSAFEKQKADFEKQVAELESSKLEYEEQFSILENNRTELYNQNSSYEENLQSYMEKKDELEEKVRSLEEQMSSGSNLTADLADFNYAGAVEVVRFRYFSELKELNRKHADLRTLREELESEEALLMAKSSGVEEIKAQIEKEFSKLKPRASELENATWEYEEKAKKHSENERMLSDIISRYNVEYALFKQRQSELKELKSVQEKQEYDLVRRKLAAFESGKLLKSEVCRINSLSEELAEKVRGFEENIVNYETDRLSYEEKLRVHTENEEKLCEDISKYESELKVHEEKRLELEKLRSSLSGSEDALREKQSEIDRHKKELEIENESLLAHQKEVDVQRTELESELESIKSKLEDNKRLEKELETTSNELVSRRRELEGLVETTHKDIGTQVTIHRQHLDIKKMSTKLEQQSVYIQSLKKSLEELQGSLEDSRKNEVFSEIVQMNIGILK